MPDWAAGLSGATKPTVVTPISTSGLPTIQTATAKNTASRKEAMGPAAATMILSKGVTGFKSLGSSALPSMASIGAICGRETKPPAGIQPNPHCTPLMVFFQMGRPNQIWNLSTYRPRQRAAKK